MNYKKNLPTKKLTNKQLEEQVRLGKIKHRREEEREREAEEELEEYKKGIGIGK
jgi:hypothetical protein